MAQYGLCVCVCVHAYARACGIRQVYMETCMEMKITKKREIKIIKNKVGGLNTLILPFTTNLKASSQCGFGEVGRQMEHNRVSKIDGHTCSRLRLDKGIEILQ